MAKRHLKPTGDLGKVIFMVRRYDTSGRVAAKSLHRNMIYGILHRWKRAFGIQMWFTISLAETIRPSMSCRRRKIAELTLYRNFDLEDVHVEGAERIAEAVAKYDVDRFIHVSSYNANKNSPSEFFRTKARGEEVVRSIFPETTIVRPAPVFGFEDRLLHKLAGVTNLITSNHMRERFWPIHVSGLCTVH